MGNSSDAYCLHLSLAFAFKSVLYWILFFCLFCGFIEYINGTDAATVWKHTWCTKASFANSSFYNFVELQQLLFLVSKASQIYNDPHQFWVTWVSARTVFLITQFYFSNSAKERNSRKEWIEIFIQAPLKKMTKNIWKTAFLI